MDIEEGDLVEIDIKSNDNSSILAYDLNISKFGVVVVKNNLSVFPVRTVRNKLWQRDYTFLISELTLLIKNFKLLEW